MKKLIYVMLIAFISALFLAGCSKSNETVIKQTTPITLKNIGSLHNQILNMYYSKYAFGTKEGVSLKDKIAVVDKYYKEHGITPLFSAIVKQDTNIIYNLKQITSGSYNFKINFKIIDGFYKRHIYSKAEYNFMKRFYDSLQPNLAKPGVIIKIINSFENELRNSKNYLPIEKNQLESVMAIAKSSMQYWTYGNGSFKESLSTEELPTWAERDISGAGSAVMSTYAVDAYVATGFDPVGYFGAILGMAAVASMI